MKNIFIAVLLTSAFFTQAQSLLSWTPKFIRETNATNVTITMDANKGNQGLLNYASPNAVWLHMGVITNKSTGPSNWKYVLTTWPATAGGLNATSLGNNKYSYTIPNSNLRTFFNITDPTEKIVKIAVLFRDAPGNLVQRNSDASDMYIPVDTNLNTKIRFEAPPTEPRYTPWVEPITTTLGQALPVKAFANKNATLNLLLNGVSIGSATSIDSIIANPILTQACNNELMAVANDGSTVDTAKLNFFVNGGATTFAPLPAGVQDGINYNSSSSVTLVLLAPKKSSVAVLGNFNNWTANCSDIMFRAPDSVRHWITINGLSPGTVYKFQYLVDGVIKTTDPYCELILDPSNDPFITASTYPNIPSYPAGQTGIVGTFMTGQTPYNWTTTNYTRPNKKSLVVYELLLRDFLKNHDWKTLNDSLNYLSKLGINCIEIMPFAEFEGNESWGYNPDFYFAPDKYYGPAQDLKKFVDAAHSKGIAVIMDATLNHVTGLSPLAQMYWNSSTNKPSADNPWLNVDAKHDFNVFNDFNHESIYTKYHVHRFIKHWLQEYKLDGFRWDLSKGFTQNNTLGNVGAWGNLDQSRVNIWTNYYDSMQAASPGSYCILEHFAVDAEESILTNKGMLIWGKATDEFKQNSMGFASSNNIERVYFKNRSGYNEPGVIGYAESHDEERINYNNLKFGNGLVKTLNNALYRQEAMHAILLSIPGPKMIWQFGELGYDYSINTCTDSVTANPLTTQVTSNCRLSKKPIRWDYFSVTGRKRIYNTISAMNHIRKLYPSLFEGAFLLNTSSLGSSLIKKVVVAHPDLDMVSVANFEITTQNNIMLTFPKSGTWYEYFSGDTINISNNTLFVNLQQGAYRVYTSKKIANPNGNIALNTNDIEFNNIAFAQVYPNPSDANATVQLSLLDDAKVKLSILDITGRPIMKFYEGNLQAGDQDLEMQGLENLSNGLYWVKIEVNGISKMMQLTLK